MIEALTALLIFMAVFVLVFPTAKYWLDRRTHRMHDEEEVPAPAGPSEEELLSEIQQALRRK